MQEADLQRYRTRLISMGQIENAAGANLKPRRHKTFEESIKAFEVTTSRYGETGLPGSAVSACHRACAWRLLALQTTL